MTPYSDEKALLAAVQQGDRKAQTQFYQLYKRRMMGICRRYARDRSEADDIFQEAILRIFTHIQTLRNPDSLTAWVRSVVIRTAIRASANAIADHSVDLEAADEALVDGEAELFARLSEENLIKLINSLPDGYRTVFNLYVIDGYSHAEIADLLGIQESTSKSQLIKAKARMRQFVHQSGIIHYGTC